MISYRDGYRYQLAHDYAVHTAIKPDAQISTMFLDLATNGVLLIRAGYAWNGPNRPAFRTKNFMRGSLVHDALYQLMQEGHLPQEHREDADKDLVRICREDGMWSIRTWWVYRGVRLGGGPSAARGERVVLTAP